MKPYIFESRRKRPLMHPWAHYLIVIALSSTYTIHTTTYLAPAYNSSCFACEWLTIVNLGLTRSCALLMHPSKIYINFGLYHQKMVVSSSLVETRGASSGLATRMKSRDPAASSGSSHTAPCSWPVAARILCSSRVSLLPAQSQTLAMHSAASSGSSRTRPCSWRVANFKIIPTVELKTTSFFLEVR